MNLPTGIRKLKSGRYMAQVSLYNMTTAQFKLKSLSTYNTLEQAVHIRNLVSDLIGNTNESKKKVRMSKVMEVVNEYRKSINLKLLKMKY